MVVTITRRTPKASCSGLSASVSPMVEQLGSVTMKPLLPAALAALHGDQRQMIGVHLGDEQRHVGVHAVRSWRC